MLIKKLLICALILLCSGPVFAGMGGMGGGGCGGGSSGGGVIDPPIGSAFRDPVEITNKSTTLGVVEVDLETKIAPININGTMANLMTYNGYYPGPTIRINKGDTLKIHHKNSLPPTTQKNFLGYQKNITQLHTHGFHVSPKAPADDVMYPLKPGETYNHEYDSSLQEAGTMCWYHPHIHGSTAEEVWAGLAGTLVVNDENDLLSGYETHILVLKDIALSGSSPAPHSTMMDFMNGKEGNIVMVNGQVNPRLNIKKGQVQRWRIVNASNARFYRLGVESHTMNLIGTDGGLLDKPYLLSEILLSPGERADVLVKGTNSSGNYRLRSLPYSRMGMMGGGMGMGMGMMGMSSGGQTITLMTLTGDGNLSPAQDIPASINPNAQRLNMDTTNLPKRVFNLGMGHGNGYINGMDFDVEPYKVTSEVGTYEVWTVNNYSCMDHPFHYHVNEGQVLSVSGSSYTSLYTNIPAWKDTLLVPSMGSVTILIAIMDYDGMAMYHCHILEHEDIGMMGVWDLMNGNGGGMDDGMDAMGVSKNSAILAKHSEFALLQNFANPFNPDTWIPYQLAESSDVAIKIFDVSGKLIRTLDLGNKPAGFYTNKDKAAYWDGKNEAGEQASSGMYFYTIQAGNYTATRKMTILK